MRKYLTAYLNYISGILESTAPQDYDALIRDHLLKIEFMQHERLIHFLVTMLFALGLFMVMGVFLITQTMLLMPLLILILVLLVPYIMHYYFLENSVQKMYKIYDELNSRRLAAEQKQRAEARKHTENEAAPTQE